MNGSAETASMQGSTATFWHPVAVFNAELSGTEVQCPKCHGIKVIASPPFNFNSVSHDAEYMMSKLALFSCSG